ncbi:MAG: hypothetical protein K0Q55_1132 [Verrucomicrobia bacterium]|jgi:hypothetical protein|nr:hypothetical protein [Verrucomicrobiota bacterium]
MNQVPRETIEAVWEKQMDFSDEEWSQWVDQFAQEQPALLVYLGAADESVRDSEEETSELMPLAALIYDSLRARTTLPVIDPEVIEEAEDANIALLQSLDDASEAEHHAVVEQLVNEYPQAPMIAFIMERLMEGNEETPDLAPDQIGMELLYLKTMIDALTAPKTN